MSSNQTILWKRFDSKREIIVLFFSLVWLYYSATFENERQKHNSAPHFNTSMAMDELFYSINSLLLLSFLSLIVQSMFRFLIVNKTSADKVFTAPIVWQWREGASSGLVVGSMLLPLVMACKLLAAQSHPTLSTVSSLSFITHSHSLSQHKVLTFYFWELLCCSALGILNFGWHMMRTYLYHFKTDRHQQSLLQLATSSLASKLCKVITWAIAEVVVFSAISVTLCYRLHKDTLADVHFAWILLPQLLFVIMLGVQTFLMTIASTSPSLYLASSKQKSTDDNTSSRIEKNFKTKVDDNLIKSMQGSAAVFSAGESIIVYSGISCYLADFIFNLIATAQSTKVSTLTSLVSMLPYIPLYFNYASNNVHDITHVFSQMLILGTMAIGLLLTPLLIYLRITNNPNANSQQKQNLNIRAPEWLFYVGTMCLIYTCICVGQFLLRTAPLKWLLYFLMGSTTRWVFCVGWIVLILFALLCMFVIRTAFSIPNIIVRKFYHFLTIVMFVPCIIADQALLRLSFSGAVGIFMILEMIRFGLIQPFGRMVDKFICSFIDDRDRGPLIVSHIYLLIGCALPIWINNQVSFHPLCPFAGVIILGIGDAMAAVIGVFFGKHKWRGLPKSIEGTVACCISSFLLCLLIYSIPAPLYPAIEVSWSAIFCACGLAAMMETFTTQNDNLLLPLFFEALLTLAAIR